MDRALGMRGDSGRWWLAALLTTGMTLCYAQRGTLSVAAPFMMRDLGLDTETMGLMPSAFPELQPVQVPSAGFIDRFGVGRAYASGFVAWSTACARSPARSPSGRDATFRIAMGAGQSVAFPASARAVANWFPDTERGLVNSSYLTGVRLGQALINAAGVALITLYGWRMLFVVAGLVPVLWIVPWLRTLRRWEPPAGAAAVSTGAPARFTFASSFGLLRHPTVLGTVLGFFAFDYVWFVFVYWLPGYLRLERHFTPAEMGFYASVPFVVMSMVIVLSGLATDRLVARGWHEVRVRKTFIAVGFAIALAIVPAGLVLDNGTSVWLLLTSLCGLGIAAPNTWSLTQACCAKRLVGTVSGLQNFGGNVGGIIAPWLTGAIAHRTGSFGPAFVLCGFILAGGALAYWLLMNDKVESLEV
jgi:MFS family permease